VPADWAAGDGLPGVSFLPDLSAQTTDAVADYILASRRDGDRVVVSMHWGSNWGYEVARQKKSFARRLVDAGAADLVHGHSSHHPRGLEIYRDRLILYGCGDFLNDYEGISGHEAYRPELTLMYFPVLEDGRLAQLTLAPMRLRRYRLQRASDEESGWLAGLLRDESRLPVERLPDGRLRVR
jgi:poly-gamma-glutamate synthesis protein (capsule biosynthesis protein)